MATLASSTPSSGIARERRFFFAMSLLLIGYALIGFGFFQVAGISSWGAPWWVHVHAISQMGWLGFYALQNWLVLDGKVAQHRRLGVFGAVYGAWLVVYGIGMSTTIVVTGRGDGMFTPAELMALNFTNMLTFGALFAAALAMRRHGDWHKRLMLSALAILSLPSMGRMLIMFGIPSTLNRTLFVLSVIAMGMVFDWRTRGQAHPAYLWGSAAAVLMGLAIGGLPMLAPFVDMANGLAP